MYFKEGPVFTDSSEYGIELLNKSNISIKSY